jgi:hypothetical protein
MDGIAGRSRAVNLERVAVADAEFLEVEAGFVMVCGCAALIVDGGSYLRLDGALKVGPDA